MDSILNESFPLEEINWKKIDDSIQILFVDSTLCMTSVDNYGRGINIPVKDNKSRKLDIIRSHDYESNLNNEEEKSQNIPNISHFKVKQMNRLNQ